MIKHDVVSPVTLTPEQFTTDLERVLSLSTPTEQKWLLAQARDWAVVSYDGAVPEALYQQLETLEERYGNA